MLTASVFKYHRFLVSFPLFLPFDFFFRRCNLKPSFRQNEDQESDTESKDDSEDNVDEEVETRKRSSFWCCGRADDVADSTEKKGEEERSEVRPPTSSPRRSRQNKVTRSSSESRHRQEAPVEYDLQVYSFLSFVFFIFIFFLVKSS